MSRQRALAMVVAATILGGCVTRPLGEPAPSEAKAEVRHYSQSVDREVDILFVVDNSLSMAEEQENLAENFPKLIDALRSYQLGADPASDRPCTESDASGCEIPDVQIGVVSTDLGAGPYLPDSRCRPDGDRGVLQNTPRLAGCTPPVQRFISYAKGVTNIPGDTVAAGDPIARVKQSFGCIARLGTGGCGFEHPLEAARRALDPAQTPENEGFIREGALLAVVLITDEDDCSAARAQLFDPTAAELGPLGDFRCFQRGIECDINDERIGPREGCRPEGDWLHPVPEFVEFFEGLKGNGRVIVAAIAGPTNRVEIGQQEGEPIIRPSCRSDLGLAAPAIRVAALVDAFGADGQFTSICDANFGPAMKALGEKIIGRQVAQCLPSPPLTEKGELACQQGEPLAEGQPCAASCLHEAACDVLERRGDEAKVIPRCPAALWYPSNWETERDCSGSGSCPCWRLVRKVAGPPEQLCLPGPDQTPYGLDILREGEAPKGAVAELNCLMATVGWTDPELVTIPRCR